MSFFLHLVPVVWLTCATNAEAQGKNIHFQFSRTQDAVFAQVSDVV